MEIGDGDGASDVKSSLRYSSAITSTDDHGHLPMDPGFNRGSVHTGTAFGMSGIPKDSRRPQGRQKKVWKRRTHQEAKDFDYSKAAQRGKERVREVLQDEQVVLLKTEVARLKLEKEKKQTQQSIRQIEEKDRVHPPPNRFVILANLGQGDEGLDELVNYDGNGIEKTEANNKLRVTNIQKNTFNVSLADDWDYFTVMVPMLEEVNDNFPALPADLMYKPVKLFSFKPFLILQLIFNFIWNFFFGWSTIPKDVSYLATLDFSTHFTPGMKLVHKRLTFRDPMKSRYEILKYMRKNEFKFDGDLDKDKGAILAYIDYVYSSFAGFDSKGACDIEKGVYLWCKQQYINEAFAIRRDTVAFNWNDNWEQTCREVLWLLLFLYVTPLLGPVTSLIVALVILSFKFAIYSRGILLGILISSLLLLSHPVEASFNRDCLASDNYLLMSTAFKIVYTLIVLTTQKDKKSMLVLLHIMYVVTLVADPGENPIKILWNAPLIPKGRFYPVTQQVMVGLGATWVVTAVYFAIASRISRNSFNMFVFLIVSILLFFPIVNQLEDLFHVSRWNNSPSASLMHDIKLDEDCFERWFEIKENWKEGGWLEALARIHNKLMHSLNGNIQYPFQKYIKNYREFDYDKERICINCEDQDVELNPDVIIKLPPSFDKTIRSTSNKVLDPHPYGPTHFSNNAWNEYMAVKGRIIAKPPPFNRNEIRNFKRWVMKNRFYIFKRIQKINPVSFDDYIKRSNASPSVKKILIATKERLDKEGVNEFTSLGQDKIRKWIKRSVFLKVENAKYKTPAGIKKKFPRPISAAQPEFIVLVGPWIMALQDHIKSVWHKKNWLVFSSGLTGEDIGRWASKWIKIFDNILEDDVSKWDVSCSRPLLEVEYNIFKLFHPPQATKELIFANLRTIGVTRFGIFYMLDGGRKSGDPYTSLGNSILNITVHLYIYCKVKKIFVRKATLYITIIAQGDDSVIIHRLAPFDWKPHMILFGFQSESMYKSNLFATSFCSSRFVPVLDGIILAPKPGSVLSKFGYFANNNTTPIHQLMSDAAICLSLSLSWAPGCIEYLRKFITHPLSSRTKFDWHIYLSRVHQPTAETIMWLNILYISWPKEIQRYNADMQRLYEIDSDGPKVYFQSIEDQFIRDLTKEGIHPNPGPIGPSNPNDMEGNSNFLYRRSVIGSGQLPASSATNNYELIIETGSTSGQNVGEALPEEFNVLSPRVNQMIHISTDEEGIIDHLWQLDDNFFNKQEVLTMECLMANIAEYDYSRLASECGEFFETRSPLCPDHFFSVFESLWCVWIDDESSEHHWLPSKIYICEDVEGQAEITEECITVSPFIVQQYLNNTLLWQKMMHAYNGNRNPNKKQNKPKNKRVVARKIRFAPSEKPKSRTKLGEAFRDGGEMLGSTFGPIGSKIGRLAGGLLSHITGQGDYKVGPGINMQKNSLLSGGPPVFGTNAGGIRVRKREYLMDISSSTTFSQQQWALQPGNPATFPWLSQIAANFEQYKIHGMVFEFRSLSADALNSTNTALGAVIMATQYDAEDAKFGSKQEMEDYEFSSSAKPSVSQLHAVECKKSKTVLSELYVRVGDVPSGADPRFYDFGTFTLATSGMQAVCTIGELWVSYDIEFLKPKLLGTIGAEDLFLHATSPSCSAAAPFGTALSRRISSTLPVTDYGVVSNGLTLYNAGTYLVQMLWSGGSGMTGPPAVGTVTGGSIQSLWAANTGGSLAWFTSSSAILTFFVVANGSGTTNIPITGLTGFINGFLDLTISPVATQV